MKPFVTHAARLFAKYPWSCFGVRVGMRVYLCLRGRKENKTKGSIILFVVRTHQEVSTNKTCKIIT